MKIKLKKVDEHLKEKLKDPYFKELYELEEQKLSIVKKVIDYRIKENITQEQLADKVGVSQQHISKIENGNFSSMHTLGKILLYIGCTVVIKTISLQPRKTKLIRRRIERLAIA